MKIVQALGWYYPDSSGGTEVYVHALSRILQSSGHDVRIAAPRAGGDSVDSYEHDGQYVWRYPVPSEPTRDEAQGRSAARGAGAFHRWLEQTRPDIVHIHTFVTGLGLAEVAAARDAGARVIVTTHASSLGFLCQRGTLMWRGEAICDGRAGVSRCAACDLEARGLSRAMAAAASHLPVALSDRARRIPGRVGTALGMPSLIAWNAERQRGMLAAVDKFVVLTQHAASIALANGAAPGQVAVNRLGVSQHFPAAHRRSTGRPLRVGYVGRYDEIKGVVDLAEAVTRLPADVPLRFEFRGIVNGPRDRDTMQDVRRRCGSDPRVSFADPVSSDRIPDVMAAYDLVCFPSRCLEGGPTAGLEAIAAGTPAIGADVGGLAEVVVDGVSGRLVPPGDVAALVDILVAIGRTPAIVDGWRAHLPRVRTMIDVAHDYEALYAA